MKKFFNLLMCLSLSVISVFTFTTTNVANAENIPTRADKLYFTEGVHDLTAEFVQTEDYIVKDGNFEYRILMPAVNTEKEGIALTEFKILLKRAIGNVPVTVVYDDAISNTFSEDDQYISIGQTRLLENANIEYDAGQLEKNGVRIITEGKSIFLIGGIDNGIINAVYTFFEIAFHYEQYTKNCLEIDTEVKNLKLIDFDVTDLPDIEYNTATYGPTASFRTPQEEDYKALMTGDITREDVANEIWMSAERLGFYGNKKKALLNEVTGRWAAPGGVIQTRGENHTTMLVYSEPNQSVPGNEGLEMKSSWFANEKFSDRHQLCYTANGHPEEIDDMQEWAANYFVSLLKTNPVSVNPGADYIPFGNMDGSGYCECVHCKADIKNNNGTYAAANVRFVSGICEKLEAKMKDEQGNWKDEDWVRPNFKILIFAYHETAQAPAEYDEELGKYVAINGLEVNEHLCMWITAYPEAHHSIYDARSNNKIASVQAWGDIATHCESWNYGLIYRAPGIFLDTMNGFSTERAQHMASLGFTINFTEVYSSQQVVTTWINLEYYMIGKQSWDSTYNAEELINNFFNAYYGPAAKTMLNLYYNQRVHQMHYNEQIYNRTGKFAEVGYTAWKSYDIPFVLIKSWIAQIDKAIIDLEPYKDIDMNLYETYRERVEIESAQYFYMIYKIHRGDAPYTIQERDEYVERLLRIVQKYNVTFITEANIRDWAKE